ncbi:lysosomal-associated transmembrane protein 4B [Cylas formicarius]|uniref:lysosomal-associated transmembrane protein 4B n=1 Tax=Cylas formicarius TaxID=197179 RepID=UPI0029587EFE|nr:lysosomal-associated transmembrane protein 4B [Cylas formicarius]XP_060522600.1 lysosomal-associated transmembrane protein 4B [Cylas formicarius]
MFAMRLKIGSIRNKEWRSCFCLHVRTATVAFGVWHLVLHVLALTVLALIMRNHNIFIQRHDDFEQNDFLPTPLSKIKNDDNPYFLPTTQDGRPILPSDIDMGALLTVCTLSITLLMVYGAIKGKPKYLLPFFFLQLFDFAITTLTATGYFCYLRSVHRLVAEHWHNLPFRQELLSLNPQYLSLLVLTSFLISIVWKAYWIGVIWRCYKYLTIKRQTARNTIHYILPGEGNADSDATYPSLFRDQEYGPMKQTPPPSYQDIMGEQPPPYPTTSSADEAASRFVFTYTTDECREGPVRPEGDATGGVPRVGESPPTSSSASPDVQQDEGRQQDAPAEPAQEVATVEK